MPAAASRHAIRACRKFALYSSSDDFFCSVAQRCFSSQILAIITAVRLFAKIRSTLDLRQLGELMVAERIGALLFYDASRSSLLTS